MSKLWSIENPFLVPDSDIQDTRSLQGYPLEVWDELVADRATGQPYRHGAFAAAELMLSEPGVEIYFVDAHSRGEKVWSESVERDKGPSHLLGFNDHGGGSESAHRILLNRFSGRGDRSGQYVLFSPPGETYEPTSTTFYRADYADLTAEPDEADRYETSVPNPLKTLEQAALMERPDDNYLFYLVGGRAHRESLVAAFRAAGFTFAPRPMERKEYERLLGTKRPEPLENQIKEEARWKRWPNGAMSADPPKGQFAKQITQLRIAEAVL